MNNQSFIITPDNHTAFTPPDFSAEQFTEMSDRELFRLCQKYGDQARYWRQKFAGLLPEVFRRRLFEKKGFSSIYEFAAKLAGMSREQVQRVLNLEKRFQSLPTLHAALVKGEVSFHKLAHIASIATPENEKELAEKAKLFSKAALEVLVRDEKCAENSGEHMNTSQVPLFEGDISETHNGFSKGRNGHESVPGNRKVSGNSLDVKFMALMPKLSEELKSKLVEMDEKGLNINDILLKLLEKRKLELAQAKEQLAHEQTEQEEKLSGGYEWRGKKRPSRYIPVKIRKHLQQEYGTKCAMPACRKAADHVHHTARWSLSQNHDPRYLAPLCKGHHEVAHMVDARVQQKRREVLRV